MFVEYESEVEEETAQVKALLEKLRIDAEVLVFWLACGKLNTYELIINGANNDIDWDIIVNEALRDEEWWDELQILRGRGEQMTSSQEMSQLAHIFDSTAGRPGVYNPHEEVQLRRPSMADMSDLQKKPPISALARMGVSMGIHTQHLHDDVLLESSSESESEDEPSSDDDMAYSLSAAVDDGNTDNSTSASQPLLAGLLRRRSGRRSTASSSWTGIRFAGNPEITQIRPEITGVYGTISEPALPVTEEGLRPASPKDAQAAIPVISRQLASPASATSPAGRIASIQPEAFPRFDGDEQMPGHVSPGSTENREATKSLRPALSRQSSGVKFSSRPVPQTQVTTEGDSSRIAFAAASNTLDTPKPAERPSFSRQSSTGKFSSRPVPGTKVTGDEENPRTISFADTPTYHSQSAAQSRHHSRSGSQYSNFGQGDASVNIESLLQSYRLDQQQIPGDEGGSSYATQGFALSFNDLPSRAQHLILNELMRQNSNDTAVLMTTLPVPSAGTSSDEEATVQYLSDIEVLCNELPPTLMVLSNNMTVTVNL